MTKHSRLNYLLWIMTSTQGYTNTRSISRLGNQYRPNVGPQRVGIMPSWSQITTLYWYGSGPSVISGSKMCSRSCQAR
ncbi:hypothetical protein F5Y16DRAFT_366095 [Xylariaceae sp. FL0255]|nr:hypothetical protein F5Y16DRAFT_366095 [Xylariaceae sp. FL0255]